MRLVPLLVVMTAACAHNSSPGAGAEAPALYRGTPAPLSQLADQSMIKIGAGSFVRGSTPEERETAYLDYERTAGHDAARRGRWFDREADAGRVFVGALRIDRTPVTNAAYAEFVRDTGRTPPTMDAATWKQQGFRQDFDSEVARFKWPGNEPSSDRADHPVVLVSWSDARDYCRWRGELVGAKRHLPSAAEFEKAARGDRGLLYPWGSNFDPTKLNSAVGGPRDTTPVGSYPEGASPYGAVDVAGNVFQWTRTPWRGSRDRYTVKGSAWDDYGGLGRGAAEHGRKRDIRHAIVGFRCASSTGADR